MKSVIITLLAGIAVYEIVEHVILPLYWIIRQRHRQSAYGPSGMLGKRCVVKQWQGTSGKVWVGGELWNATSPSPLIPGNEPIITGLDHLTLLVAPDDQFDANPPKAP